MSWYDDICRYLIDSMGIRAKIIYVETPKECNPFYYSLSRNELKNAFFIELGTCDKQGNGILRFTTAELFEVIKKSKDYAKENAYIILVYTNTERLSIKVVEQFAMVIRYISEQNLKPVVINFSPTDFLTKTNLYYDQAILLLGRLKDTKSLKEHERKFKESIMRLKDILLSADANNATMLETNAALGNGPLIKPMLFTKTSSKSSLEISTIDIIASLMLIYSIFHLYRQRQKKINRLKLI